MSDEFSDLVAKFLSSPEVDPSLVPVVEEIFGALHREIAGNRNLERYKETVQRLGPARMITIVEPSFQYTLQSD